MALKLEINGHTMHICDSYKQYLVYLFLTNQVSLAALMAESLFSLVVISGRTFTLCT